VPINVTSSVWYRVARSIRPAFAPSRRGQTLVEFALALPLLISIIVAGVDLARYVSVHTAATAASREATRYASAVGPSSEATPRYINCAGMRTAAQAASPMLDLSGAGALTIAYEDGDGDLLPAPSVCPPAGGKDDVHRLDRVVVTVTARFTPTIPLLQSIDIVATDRRTVVKEATP
jgi:Flp pilus assembly protein TadG